MTKDINVKIEPIMMLMRKTRKMKKMTMMRIETNVKAKSIMTLMLVAARANKAKTPAASFAHLYIKEDQLNPQLFVQFYLHYFLPLNNLRLLPLYLRDSEIRDPCLHFFLLLLFLCFLHLMLGVADGLIYMLVQQLKELVDIPATVEFHNYTLSPRETFPSPKLPKIAN